MKKDDLAKKMAVAAKAEECALDDLDPRGSDAAKPKDPADSSPGKAKSKTLPEDSVSVHDTTPRQTEQVFAILADNPSSGLVLYGGKLHRIARREGHSILELHTRDSLLGHIGRTVTFVKRSKDDEWRECNPTARLMDDILSLGEYPEGIPCVRWIKTTPLLTAAGELIATSGLYPEHEVFLEIDPSLEGLEIPKTITRKHLDRAAADLLDPFDDFPVDEGSTANLVAVIFTMVFREWIDGVIPIVIIDGNTAGTGKGLLISVLAMIAYGRQVDFSPGNVDSNELRKRLLAIAGQGAPVHVLDNIEQTVWSADLAAWLTAPSYSDRRLGETTLLTYPNTLIILGTGNNIRIGGDIGRRAVLIRLVTPHARPEERGDFRYPQLLRHVAARRRPLLQAIYTVAAAWLRAGKPVPSNAPQMGSFQPWADFSAGILHTLDATGLLDNREMLRVRDQDAEDYETMLSRTRRIFGTNEFTAKELVQQLDAEDFPSALGGRRHSSLSKSMGRLLTRIEGRSFGEDELTVRHHRTVDKTKHYRVEDRVGRAAKGRNATQIERD